MTKELIGGRKLVTTANVGGFDLSGEVPSRWRTGVYRIVQESLVNAARHSGGARVDVRVRSEPSGAVEVVVTDDGGGFDFDGVLDLEELGRRGLGPRSLMERVEGLGGELAIESRSSSTRVVVRLAATEAEES